MPHREQLEGLLIALERYLVVLFRLGMSFNLAGSDAMLEAAVAAARKDFLDAIERMDDV